MSFSADDLSGVDAFAARYSDRNIFVSVATRGNATERGLIGCHELHALVVDLDYGSRDEPDQNTRASIDADHRARLDAFPLLPSIVVHSGGGLHAYWLLTETFDLRIEKCRGFATVV